MAKVIFEFDEEEDKAEIYDVLQKEDFIDGLHPNQKGHKEIFERIKEYINE